MAHGRTCLWPRGPRAHAGGGEEGKGRGVYCKGRGGQRGGYQARRRAAALQHRPPAPAATHHAHMDAHGAAPHTTTTSCAPGRSMVRTPAPSVLACSLVLPTSSPTTWRMERRLEHHIPPPRRAAAAAAKAAAQPLSHQAVTAAATHSRRSP